MTTYVLFGVKASTLNAARDEVEKVLQVTLDPREGLHNGGDYYSLGFPKMVLTLKNNIDLDDEEMEFGGLAEPDFPKDPYLLYLDDAETVPHILAALEGAPDLFRKLRTDVV
jgi:hypothetical protein